MMFENNGMMGAPMMGGYSYNGMAQPMQKFNNVLTPEQIKQLQQKGNQFSLSLTEEDILRGICNHRNADGTGDALTIDPLTGVAMCTICGHKFRPIEPNVEPAEIKEDVERIVDILQTIKLMYVDLPAEAANEYFPIIPLIEKVPQLFEFAAKNMTKHETYNWQYNNKNMGAVTMLNNLQNILAGNMGFNPGMQMQQPQQPMMGAPMGYPMSNGFGYPGAGTVPPMGNPVLNNGYMPQTTGFQYTPGQNPVQPVAPTVPEAPKTEATVTQNVTV